MAKHGISNGYMAFPIGGATIIVEERKKKNTAVNPVLTSITLTQLGYLM